MLKDLSILNPKDNTTTSLTTSASSFAYIFSITTHSLLISFKAYPNLKLALYLSLEHTSAIFVLFAVTFVFNLA